MGDTVLSLALRRKWRAEWEYEVELAREVFRTDERLAEVGLDCLGEDAIYAEVSMNVEPDEAGVVRVKGKWVRQSDHLDLTACSECGKKRIFYLSDLPYEWHNQVVVVSVRLAGSEE